jgi:outer membrane receptor protein involved in Fe transport
MGSPAAFIRGRVLDPQERPVAEATVELLDAGGKVLAQTLSDGEGWFTLPGEPPPGSRVRIRSEGFLTVQLSAAILAREPRDLSLTIAGIAETVGVTATRRERSLFDTPQSVSVVEYEDMEERAIATAPDALEGLPGVLVQKTTLGGGAPILRGMVGNQVLLLVDGIRLNNSNYRLGPNQYLNSVDRFGADRIEVVRGPTSSLYGSDALGGTVNVLTESLPDSGDEIEPRFSLGYDGATNAPIFSGRMRGRGEKLAYLGGLTFASFDDIRGGADTGTQSPTGFDRKAGDFKLGYDFGRGGVLYGAGQYFEDDDVPRYDRIAAGRDQVHLFTPQRRSLAYLRYQNELEILGRPALSATLSRMNQTEGREIQARGSTSLSLERDEVITYGVGLQLSWPETRRFEWTAGFELYEDSIGSERASRNLSTGQERSERPRLPDGASYRSGAVYAQAAFRAGSRLDLLVGGRYNRFAANAILEGVEEPYQGQFDALTGSANAVFAITPNLHLSGGVSEGFRAPALEDTAVFGQFNAGYDVPSTDVAPESLLNYEATLKLSYPRLWTSFTVFDAHVDGLIGRAPGTYLGSSTYLGEPVFQRQNIDDAEITGAELDVGFWPLDRVNLSLAVAGLSGSDTRTQAPLTRMPPFNGRFRARYHLPWGSRFSPWLELMTDFATKQDRLSSADQGDSRIPPGGTPGFVVVSALAGLKYGDSYQLNLVFHNLGDADYRYHGSGINGPGRSLRAFFTAQWQ